MDLTIRTLQGNCSFQSVLPDLTVDEFKKQLYDAAVSKKLVGLNIPEPERQNIVFRGNALLDGSLEDAGVRSGDSVVILYIPPPPAPIQRQTTGPSKEAIAAAIRGHAINHGMESHLMAPDKARSRPRPLVTTDGAVLGSDQLEIIVDALQESLGRRLPANHAENEEEAEEAEEEPHEQELTIPEPSADHVQIITESTGFDAAVARKALILHRNDLNAAVNWLFEHQNDADFTEPIPQSTLFSLYGQPRYHRRYLHARPELVAQLMEMGFEEEQSREALVRMRNSMDLAILLLLRRSRATQQQDAHVPPTELTGEAPQGQSSADAANPVDAQPAHRAPDQVPQEADAVEHTQDDSVPPASLDWSHVDFEEAEDMPDEPPASEVNVDLVDESDVLAASSDFDQGDVDGVSLNDIVRFLGGDEADHEGLRTYMQRLAEGSDEVQLPYGIPGLTDFGDAEPEGDSSAVYDTLAEMLNVVRDSSQHIDPYGAGPSGEAHEDLEDFE